MRRMLNGRRLVWLGSWLHDREFLNLLMRRFVGGRLSGALFALSQSRGLQWTERACCMSIQPYSPWVCRPKGRYGNTSTPRSHVQFFRASAVRLDVSL